MKDVSRELRKEVTLAQSPAQIQPSNDVLEPVYTDKEHIPT